MRLADPAWDTFARALYGRALGRSAPAWTKVKPLPKPTYLLDEPVFRTRAEAVKFAREVFARARRMGMRVP